MVCRTSHLGGMLMVCRASQLGGMLTVFQASQLDKPVWQDVDGISGQLGGMLMAC